MEKHCAVVKTPSTHDRSVGSNTHTSRLSDTHIHTLTHGFARPFMSNTTIGTRGRKGYFSCQVIQIQQVEHLSTYLKAPNQPKHHHILAGGATCKAGGESFLGQRSALWHVEWWSIMTCWPTRRELLSRSFCVKTVMIMFVTSSTLPESWIPASAPWTKA